MNLREDKHWAYGAYSQIPDARGQRLFFAYAPVQTDKTAESAAEMLREVKEVVGARPLTTEEIAKIKANDVRSLPGGYETASAVLGALAENALYGRPDDYIATLKQRTEAQTDDAVRAAATQVIHPEQLTWVIVGDLQRIEAGIRKLDLGPIQVLDADGKPVK
jgi:predicted Zn-dependent peptidase